MKKILKAYGKINLRLKVIESINYEGNIYHNLEMINKRIKLYDKIILIKSDFDSINYIYNKNIKEEFINSDKDTILKAYNYFKFKYHIHDYFNITIYRNIPIGSGLGSIPAIIGELFKYFNQLYNLSLSNNELIEDGMKFGMDVPYMFYNKLAVVRELGNKISVLDTKFNQSLIIVYPNIKVSTKKVFDCTNINNKETIINSFNNDLVCNDLENITLKLYPELINVKLYLSRLNPNKLVMSGSGSSFVLLVDKKDLNNIYNKIVKDTNYFVYKERI